MNDLKLFSIHARQQWYSDVDVLVLADSLDDASRAVKCIVKLEPYDDGSSEMEMTAKEISILSLDDIKLNPDMWFLAKEKNGTFDWFEFEEFKSFISEEKLEEMRIKNLEKNNGQLSLLED